MAVIDGPRLPPASRRPADALIVFLHGYGADGNDLIAIGREWSRALPNAAFAAPHAPSLLPGSPGRQWFPLTMRDPTEYWRGVNAAQPGLDAFLDAELARTNVSPERLVLVGFSQGTMMALHVGLRRKAGPAAVIGYSGLLPGPEHLRATTGRPELTLLHGDHDEVIPVDYMMMSASALGIAEIPVIWHICPGLGHGIDARGLAIGLDAVTRALAPPRRR